MPIAKSAPAPEVTVKVEPTQATESSYSNFQWMDVPIDVYRQFSIELGTIPEREVGKIKDIYEWAKSKCDEPTIGNIMQKISSLEQQLGSPALGHQRYDKLWNWVKITKQIDDLDKRRDALRKKWQI
jgi:hypothetical protein